ncbi:Cadherin-87A [Nymphon striatum]|nr:Cadherin-87A [Nymphon striatum]
MLINAPLSQTEVLPSLLSYIRNCLDGKAGLVADDSAAKGNLPPTFVKNMNLAVITENSPIGSSVYRLQGEDPEGSAVFFGIEGTDKLGVNRQSGEVTITAPIDREKNGTLNFSVTLEDRVGSGNEDNVVKVPVSVIILDENDNNPQFTNDSYGTAIFEDTPVGTTILSNIVVTDIDQVGSSIDIECQTEIEGTLKVVVRVIFPDTCKKFKVVSMSKSSTKSIASILLQEPVNYAEQNSYRLKLSATDGSLNTSTIVIIKVTDIQNSPPIFIGSLTGIVREDAPVGTLVMTLKAVDGDMGNPRPVRYSLQSNPEDFFSVDSRTGEVRTTQKIDPRTSNTVKWSCIYKLQNMKMEKLLTVADAQTTKMISITIRDVNDEPPTFNKHEYNVYIDENVPNGTPLPNMDMVVEDTDVGSNSVFGISLIDSSGIFSVEPPIATGSVANDLDEGPYGQAGLVYSLFGNGAERFQVNSKTGVITVAPCATPGKGNCLDYESRSTYYLSFQAIDNFSAGQTTIVPFTISLADSNDNPPKFLQDTYTTIIDEGDTEFVPLLQVQAKDPDVTSNLQYSIVSGNAIDLLSINTVTGIIRITDQLNGLDVSGLNTDLIILTVQASDGGDGIDTATVKINVRDANNNVPIFDSDSHTAEILEGSDPGTVVEQVAASDADTGINGQIRYRINKGAYDHFEITPNTGIISVSNTTKLDYDRQKLYNIEVFAVDGGSPINTGSTTVMVKILNSNDKAPFFTPSTQRAQISEGAKPGEVFYKLQARDPDFVSKESLRFKVMEPINAVDKDGHQIKVDESGFKKYFSINENTGEVQVATKLNRDLVAIVTMTVSVTDIQATPPQIGTGRLVVTIIDVNDHPPIFSPPWTETTPETNFSIVEEQTVGNVVYTFAATDADSNIDIYKIQPPNKYFNIDNTSGVLMVKSRIDYESIQAIKFEVLVLDKGVPQLTSTATVNVNIININDKDPMFTEPSYHAAIRENSVKGTPITMVKASDGDLGKYGEIKYELIGEYKDSFVIDQKGMIRVKMAEKLDREATKSITLQVVASDQGNDTGTRRSVSVPIYITLEDENDNSPKFAEKQYQTSIVENIPTVPPSPILQVMANDPDEGKNAKLMYKIVQGNIDEIFYIHPTSGIISPVKSLGGRGLKQYKLTIEARDRNGLGPNFDETLVYINVLDINQDKPQFAFPRTNSTINIPENQTLPETLVMTVTAVDMDYGENGRLSYYFKIGNKNVESTDFFQIDVKTGDLKTKIILDREIQSKYELVLVAKDHGSPLPFETLRFVTIELDDVDDNYPQFPRTQSTDPYLFEIDEDNKISQVVGQVKATDSDIGQNALIYYFILGGNKDENFVIDKISGTIRANAVLDREARDHYDLVIKATNDANYDIFERKAMIKTTDIDYNPEDFTLALVKISVGDINDNEPVFVNTPYLAGIRHSEQVGHLVKVVKAIDPDKKTTGMLKYFIARSDLFKLGQRESLGSVSPSPFNISSDGRIVISTLFTPFNQNRFEITVVAREAFYPHREAREIVKVWVYEANQLIRVIIAQPPERIAELQVELINVLSNATGGIVVIDDIKYHVTSQNKIDKKWTDMYIHVVSLENDEIVAIPNVLESLDQNFDFLSSQYQTFYIKNVLPAYVDEKEMEFDPTLAALIALIIVLFVGLITVLVVCRCIKYWFTSKINSALVKNEEMADVTGGIVTKLKLYEEQELSMHVFNDPEHAAAIAAAAREGSITSLNTTEGANISFGDETASAVYATLDKSAQQRGSSEQGSRESTIDRMKMKGITFPTANIKSGFDTTGSRDGYASIGGVRYANVSGSRQLSDENTYHELRAASSGHQKSQDNIPNSFSNGMLENQNIANKSSSNNLEKSSSTLTLTNDGEPQLVSELM